MVLVSIIYDPIFEWFRFPDRVEVTTVLGGDVVKHVMVRYILFVGDRSMAFVIARKFYDILALYNSRDDYMVFAMVEQRRKVFEDLEKAWKEGCKKISSR